MPAVGLAVLFLGYSVTYYGITQIRGGNWGFLDLVLPGRWTLVQQAPPPKDNKADTEGVPTQSANPLGAVSAFPGSATVTLPNALGDSNPSPGLPMD